MTNLRAAASIVLLAFSACFASFTAQAMDFDRAPGAELHYGHIDRPHDVIEYAITAADFDVYAPKALREKRKRASYAPALIASHAIFKGKISAGVKSYQIRRAPNQRGRALIAI